MTMRFMRLMVALAAIAVFGECRAQPAGDFYRGKQITIIVASDAGSGYDAYARLLSRHIGRYIPGNPYFVIQNLAAAGGMTMANQIANTSPKDGTVIAATQASAAFERLLHLLSPNGDVARFDATKLNWLGTMTQEVNVLIASAAAPATTIEQLKTTEFANGAAGPNTDGAIVAILMNKMLGTKIKLVTGYTGAAGEFLAIERREIDGAALNFGSALALKPDIVTDPKFKIVLQTGEAPHPKLKHVPFLTDIVKTEEDKAMLELIFSKFKMGKPFFVAEGVPADRVALLREAFDKTMKDPEFLADADKSGLEIDPADGVEIQKLVQKLYAVPEERVIMARKILGRE